MSVTRTDRNKVIGLLSLIPKQILLKKVHKQDKGILQIMNKSYYRHTKEGTQTQASINTQTNRAKDYSNKSALLFFAMHFNNQQQKFRVCVPVCCYPRSVVPCSCHDQVPTEGCCRLFPHTFLHNNYIFHCQ